MYFLTGNLIWRRNNVRRETLKIKLKKKTGDYEFTEYLWNNRLNAKFQFSFYLFKTVSFTDITRYLLPSSRESCRDWQGNKSVANYVIIHASFSLVFIFISMHNCTLCLLNAPWQDLIGNICCKINFKIINEKGIVAMTYFHRFWKTERRILVTLFER